MNFQHKELAQGRWKKLSFFEQMANVGSEVERAIKWREKNKIYSELAFFRSLELLDLTMADEKNVKRLREIARVREALADYFYSKNEYHSTEKNWRNYFYAFSFAARLKM